MQLSDVSFKAEDIKKMLRKNQKHFQRIRFWRSQDGKSRRTSLKGGNLDNGTEQINENAGSLIDYEEADELTNYFATSSKANEITDINSKHPYNLGSNEHVA